MSQRSVPASVVRVEGRSIVEDRRPRNSYHRVCYVFAARAASECHWNWSAVGDGQRPTEGDSRLRGTREPLQRATGVRAPRSWTQRADGLAASAAAVTPVWCGHTVLYCVRYSTVAVCQLFNKPMIDWLIDWLCRLCSRVAPCQYSGAADGSCIHHQHRDWWASFSQIHAQCARRYSVYELRPN